MKKDNPFVIFLLLICFLLLLQVGWDFVKCFFSFVWFALTHLTHPHQVWGYFLLSCWMFGLDVVGSIGSDILFLLDKLLGGPNDDESYSDTFSNMMGAAKCFYKAVYYKHYGVDPGLVDNLLCPLYLPYLSLWPYLPRPF